MGKKRMLVFLAGLLTAFLLLETGLRITGFFFNKYITSARPSAGNGQGGHVVLCLGNSFTLGLGAPPGQSYPDQLRRIFNQKAKGRPVAIINGGVGGETSAELLSKLKDNIKALKPDILLVQTGQANWGFYYKYSDYLKRTSGDGAFFQKAVFLLNDLFDKSCVYRLFFNVYVNGRAKIKGPYPGFEDQDIFGKECRAHPGMGERRRCFDQKIKMAPPTAQSYVAIGQAYLAQGRHEEALPWLMKAVEAVPFGRYNVVGYSLIRMLRGQLMTRGPYDEVIGKIDRFTSRFEGAALDGGRNLLLLSDDEISQWVASDIREVVAIARQKGIKIILQDYPMAHTVNRVLRAVAAELKVPFVDHERIFQEEMDRGTPRAQLLQTLEEGGHCPARGYGLTAANVYDKIMEEKMLEVVE